MKYLGENHLVFGQLFSSDKTEDCCSRAGQKQYSWWGGGGGGAC